LSVSALSNLRLTATQFHFTDYCIRVYYIHTTDSSIQKGTSVTWMASDSAKAGSQGGSTPPIRPATPSSSKEVRQKFRSWLRKPFSKGKKSDVTESKSVEAEIAHEQNLQTTSMAAPETLLVTTESIHIKPDIIDPARKVAGYELAISAIEIFQSVVEYTEFIVPTPVGKALEQLTNVLGVLKVSSRCDDSGSTNNAQ
jgi:hypothetical protein